MKTHIQHTINADSIIQIVEKYNNNPQQLTAILHDVQEVSGGNYVDESWAKQIADLLGIPVSHVYEVMTFYSMLNTSPKGKVLLEVCNSTPCRFNRAGELLAWCKEELGIGVGETSADGEFGIAFTSCVGACDFSPVLKIGDDVFGNLDRNKLARLISSFRENRPELRESLICQN